MPSENVYIDACPWISFYKPGELNPEQESGMNSLFADAESGHIVVIGSHLIYMQVLSVSAETLEIAFDGRKGLLVPLDETVSVRARLLQNDCFKATRKALGSEDAAHLATAALMGCKKFVTLDRKRKDGHLSPYGDRQILEPLLGLSIILPEQIAGQPVLPMED